MSAIKLFISDIDGVLTKNSVYDSGTDIFKRFNQYDKIGVALLMINNIKIALITELKNKVIEERFLKHGINDIVLGASDKLKVAKQLKKKYNLEWDEIAYIGDEINDMDLLEKVGLSAVPGQSPHYVKSVAKLKLTKEGGEGAFREFVENYLDQQGILIQTINSFRKLHK